MKTQTHSQDDIQSAKQAVAFFWNMRNDLPDTCDMADWIEEFREEIREAKSQGERVLDYLPESEIIYFAERANEICEDMGMPYVWVKI